MEGVSPEKLWFSIKENIWKKQPRDSEMALYAPMEGIFF